MKAKRVLCSICEGVISSNAYECPHCGNVRVKWLYRCALFTGAAFVICLPLAALLLLLLALLFKHSNVIGF